MTIEIKNLSDVKNLCQSVTNMAKLIGCSQVEALRMILTSAVQEKSEE